METIKKIIEALKVLKPLAHLFQDLEFVFNKHRHTIDALLDEHWNEIRKIIHEYEKDLGKKASKVEERKTIIPEPVDEE